MQVKNRRRVLCVFPRFVPGFASFYHTSDFGVKAFMPPQGILTIAAYLPREWDIRVLDENTTLLTDALIRWADVVMVSGMHAQRERMAQIAARARRLGVLSVAGGSSVSACPSYHPSFDVLHVGELGDATDRLIARLDEDVSPTEHQEIFETKHRLPIEEFPIPAYDQVNLADYLVLNVQWSSGCPYRCEFCDIPELYGRKARAKSPERLIAELDTIAAQQPVGGLWFVDDNLIANRRAAKELMPHLVRWQQKTGYRIVFIAEASINLAKDHEMLELMREARFTDLFVGIESSDVETLAAIDKRQNLLIPIEEAVRTFNSYGIELSAGIIFGFDSDGPDTGIRAIDFITRTGIPIAGLNLLYALPKTPMWRRLEAEGRLVPDAAADESNIVFKLPYEEVIEQYRRAVDSLYAPRAVYDRYRHNFVHTYPNRKDVPAPKLSASELGGLLWRIVMILYVAGIRASYRREFWRIAKESIRCGRFADLLPTAMMAHHLILFREDVLAGRTRASTFSHRPGTVTDPPDAPAPISRLKGFLRGRDVASVPRDTEI